MKNIEQLAQVGIEEIDPAIYGGNTVPKFKFEVHFASLQYRGDHVVVIHAEDENEARISFKQTFKKRNVCITKIIQKG